MSVQRWAEGFRGGGVRAVDGEWVTYADHVAALAEAERRFLATMWATGRGILEQRKSAKYEFISSTNDGYNDGALMNEAPAAPGEVTP